MSVFITPPLYPAVNTDFREKINDPELQIPQGERLRREASLQFEIEATERYGRALDGLGDLIDISEDAIEGYKELGQKALLESYSSNKNFLLREDIEHKLNPSLPKPSEGIFGDDKTEIEKLLESAKLLKLASKAAIASESELITIKHEVRKIKNRIYGLGNDIDLTDPRQVIAYQGVLDQLNAAESVIKLKEKEGREGKKVDGLIAFYEVKAGLQAATNLNLIENLSDTNQST